MSRFKLKFAIAVLFVLSLPLAGQGYEIEINVKQMAGKPVILGEYFTSRMVPKDTVILDKAGKGVFRGETAFKGGLYILYFSPTRIADFLMDKNQRFSIRIDPADLLNKTVFSGSSENVVFQEYKKYLEKQRTAMNALKTELEACTDAADSTRIRKNMDELNRQTGDYIDGLIEKDPGLFSSTFLRAMKDVEVPEELLKGTKQQVDSIRYFYYKNHFFDNMDPADVRLLHTPLYEPRVKTYIEKVVTQIPDSLIAACDYLIGKTRNDDELFRYMLVTLFNYFADSKYVVMDKVYFHIAEKYYIPYASWSSPDFITKLKENLELNKPTFVGNTAPDFTLRAIAPELVQLSATDTTLKKDPHIGYSFNLHQINSKFTLLYFWEADCGHCKKSSPELQEVYERIKDKGVTVLACHVINSVEGKVLWMDFLNEYGMYDWINCWSPYNNDFRKMYNLQSFPQLFLLDKDKKIIAKRLTPQQAEEIINSITENESSGNSQE
ncbi:MAG: redoxin family protein [Bacteroidota bacterium]